MGIVFAQGAGGGAQRRVGPEHDVRFGEDAPHVLFAHPGKEGRGAKAIRLCEVQHGFRRMIEPERIGHLQEIHSAKPGVVRMFGRSDHDSRPVVTVPAIE